MVPNILPRSCLKDHGSALQSKAFRTGHRGSGEEQPSVCVSAHILRCMSMYTEPRPYVGIWLVMERPSVSPAWAIFLSFEVDSQ